MKALPIVLLAAVSGFTGIACGPSVECPGCAEGEQSAAGTGGAGTGASSGSGAAPGTTASVGASTGASTSSSTSATTGSGGTAGAPTEGVPCDLSQAAWMGYVIKAIDMVNGAGDPDGPGFCEGWVYFEPEWFQTSMYDEEAGDFVYVQANGSTELDEGCEMSHCGKLLHASGKTEQQMCSVYAACENGVAHSVAYDW